MSVLTKERLIAIRRIWGREAARHARELREQSVDPNIPLWAQAICELRARSRGRDARAWAAVIRLAKRGRIVHPKASQMDTLSLMF